MKFLVNSKYLHSKIAEAIGKESEAVSLDGSEIIFSDNGGVTEMTVEVREKHNTDFEFYPAYWRSVILYLKQLPEQPLSVDLCYDRVEIYAVNIFRIHDLV